MTRDHDAAAAAFVTGAMLRAGAVIAPGSHDITCPMFDVPGMGRVRVLVEAVQTTDETKEAADGGEA